MPINNSDIAKILNKVADLLDIKGENRFRVRAYRNAAQTITGLSRSLREMVEEEEDLKNLPGIGKDMARKIKEIAETGKLKQLERIKKRVPEELSEMMKIPDLGPKRVGVLYRKLEIKNIDELEDAASTKKIRKLRGFGKKTEENILKEIDRRRKSRGKGRIKFVEAEQITEPLLKYLQKIDGVKRVEAAGSYRRKKETVGDLDILAICDDGEKVMDRFVRYEDTKRVISKGETRSSIVLRSGFQVDLRVVAPESYGAALHYFTGSKAHNVAIRRMAQQKDLKINEYGVFKGKKRIAGQTEDEVYAKVDVVYIQPELRENRGEIEAAKKEFLPKLITIEDIKGDLQCHTKASDGKFTLSEMAEAAMRRGYEYLAITDHSKRVTVAGGLDEKRLREQMEEIDSLSDKMKNFKILKSIEVDILEEGTLDLPDNVLEELDLVVCSIHYNFNLSQKKQTDRVLKAMDNPHFNIFSHPTGRIIGKRAPYDIDMEAIIKKAKKVNCCLEINAQPERLDLSDIHCKKAKENGVMLSIATDAHSGTDLDFMRFGIAQARRGWLEAGDVLNTRSWQEIEKLLKR